MEQKPSVGSRGLFISVDGTAEAAIVLVCQLDTQFERSRDTIDALSKCGPDQRPANDYTANISGSFQAVWDDSGTIVWNDKASTALADQLFRDKTIFNFAYGPLTGIPAPGEVTYKGKGFFSNLTDNDPNNDMSTVDFGLAIAGPYTMEVEPATT